MKIIELEKIGLTLRDNGTDRQILKDVCMEIEEGEIYGLIGNNGAGKTSLLRIITGLTVKYDGKIRIFESDDLKSARQNIGVVTDSPLFDESLSALQYLKSIAYIYGNTDGDICRDLIEKVGLEDAGKKKISNYSLGMKRRLAIASALVGKPKLLIMDEPFNGVDTNGMMEIRLLFQRLSSEGLTILITSHIIPELMKLSTSYGIMYEGSMIQQYKDRELKNISGNKLAVNASNPFMFIENLHSRVGNYYCNSESNGQVTVYGDVDRSRIEENLSDCYDVSAGIREIKINDEDILLWRMNGYEV